MYNKKYSKLTVGQLVELKIIESGDNIVLVSFQGDLLRVSNKTGQDFVKDNKIKLIVKRINPIEFALPSTNGFNVWV